MEVLELARWPVGGIRTYFRYVFGDARFRRHRLTFAVPDRDVLPLLQRHLPAGSFFFVPVRNSTADLAWATLRLLITGNYALVHSHGFTAGAIATPLCRLFGVPHLMTAHDVFQPGQFRGIRGRIKRAMLGKLFSGIDAIHAVTNDGAANIVEYFPVIRRERLHTILHGIDVEAFRTGPVQDLRAAIGSGGADVFLIGFFGRFMAQKGFRYLVGAIDLLVRERQLPRKPLVLAFGDGGYAREDFAMIAERGLEEYFVRIPHTDDIAAALRGVDLVAMPSLWEACGLLAMEALVAGTPIVGTGCIGLREVLDGSPACTVEPADSVALADAVEQELRTPRRQEFADYAPQAALRFALEQPVQELLALYANTAGKAASGYVGNQAE